MQAVGNFKVSPLPGYPYAYIILGRGVWEPSLFQFSQILSIVYFLILLSALLPPRENVSLLIDNKGSLRN